MEREEKNKIMTIKKIRTEIGTKAFISWLNTRVGEGRRKKKRGGGVGGIG